MRSHPGVTAKFFSALAAADVNIEMISTSEIRISVVVDQDDVDRAVAAAHTAFGLDCDRGGRRLRRHRTLRISSVIALRQAARLMRARPVRGCMRRIKVRTWAWDAAPQEWIGGSVLARISSS